MKRKTDESDYFLYAKKADPIEVYTYELTKDESFNDKVRAILESAGIHTYGDFLAYAENHYFSDLPGIDARTAEQLHRTIESAENVNKTHVVAKLGRTYSEFSNLEQISQAQIANGQEIAKSM